MEERNYIIKMIEKALDSAKDQMIKGYNQIPEGSMKDRCKVIIDEINECIRTGNVEKLSGLKNELLEIQKSSNNAGNN